MKRFIPYIQYLWHITEGFHRTIALRTLLGVMRVGTVLSFIWLSKTAIDCATGRVPAETSTLVLWFGLMAACMFVDVGFSQGARYIEARANVKMTNRIDRKLFNVLMTMPLVDGRQGFHSGDMLNRFARDVNAVTNFSLSQLPAMIVMLVQLVGAFVFLACMNPYLALAPVAITPICLLAGKLYFRQQRRLTAEIRESESDIYVSIQEGLKHRTVLKSLECIVEIDHRLGTMQQKLDSSNKQQTKLSSASAAMTRLGFILGYLTAFGWSIFSLKAGVITFGTMSAFIQLVHRIQNPIAGLSGYVPIFISTSVAIDRLREIDTWTPEKEAGGECSPLAYAGVRVKDLSFRYEAQGKDVLTSFSYDFKPGSRTMIIGSTGAGKTTLIKLLLGLLRPNSGTIEIYSGDTSTRASSATLCNFAYVPQGNTLLHGTIRDNLRLGAPRATDEQFARVLHIAAADFVFDLPHGLDSTCDEAGSGLSEGQAQRIAIARALLRPGSILLLDEFNSALDGATAKTLMQRLSESCPDSTIIVIAHHRSAIAPYCDNILRIDSGVEGMNTAQK
ncbi:MAG: ABC transporter ATP-binding protein/permease [Muribaculaceae bacterium]|nr:ABC transporter ATP-binding protein/permease [Muribaculaceae bacterium]